MSAKLRLKRETRFPSWLHNVYGKKHDPRVRLHIFLCARVFLGIDFAFRNSVAASAKLVRQFIKSHRSTVTTFLTTELVIAKPLAETKQSTPAKRDRI